MAILMNIMKRNTKDETLNHMFRCSKVAKEFGIYLGFSEDKLYLLKTGAYLHDIGKFKIPKDILYKPYKLTEEEFRIIKTHTIISDISGYDKNIMDIIRQHHERIDGTGYPLGLISGQINPLAKVMAIVDVYDAIISKRSYKGLYSKEYALKAIESGKSTQFDAELVGQFSSFIEHE
ncbi:TPA: HD domain-containing protein [Clostridium botulinum]|nr:HD domain-containing protein [Clostridium botulinum]